MTIATLSPLTTPLLLASGRAPKQEANVLASSAVLLQAQRPRQTTPSSQPNTPAVFGAPGKDSSPGPRTAPNVPAQTFKSP